MTREQAVILKEGALIWLRGFVLMSHGVVGRVVSPRPVVFGALNGKRIKFSHESPYTKESGCSEGLHYMFLTGREALVHLRGQLQQARDFPEANMDGMVLEDADGE